MSTASIIAFLAFLSAFNVPQATVNNISAILYASQASTTQVVATTTLQATPSTDATLTTTNTPNIGGILSAMPQSQAGVLVSSDYERRNPSTEQPFGQWGWTVSLLDDSGAYVQNAPITMTIGTSTETRNTTNTSTFTSKDWNKDFQFIPTQAGQYTVTFSSGDQSTSVTIEVK